MYVLLGRYLWLGHLGETEVRGLLSLLLVDDGILTLKIRFIAQLSGFLECAHKDRAWLTFLKIWFVVCTRVSGLIQAFLVQIFLDAVHRHGVLSNGPGVISCTGISE